jgi:hypothetical protein
MLLLSVLLSWNVFAAGPQQCKETIFYEKLFISTIPAQDYILVKGAETPKIDYGPLEKAMKEEGSTDQEISDAHFGRGDYYIKDISNKNCELSKKFAAGGDDYRYESYESHQACARKCEIFFNLADNKICHCTKGNQANELRCKVERTNKPTGNSSTTEKTSKPQKRKVRSI